MSAKLSAMSQDLRGVITDLNAGVSGGVGVGAGQAASASDPLSAIVGILNNQLKALSWIDRQCLGVEEKIKEIAAAEDNGGAR